MQVGIYTRYLRHAATYAAIEVAEQCQLAGHDVTILTDDKIPTPTHHVWDGLVKRDGPRGFTHWAKRCDTIIWMLPPLASSVNWARDAGKHTIVVAPGCDLQAGDKKALRAADIVVTPSRRVARIIQQRWKLTNIYPIDWVVGWPITQKAKPHEKLRLLLPTEFCYPALDIRVLAALAATMAKYEHVESTVTYIPSRWHPHAHRALMAFADKFKSRVCLHRSVPYKELPMLYQRHDLTVWPSEDEDFCFGGLASLTMGTPVVCWAACPMNELVTAKNGIPVPCGEIENELGLPCVDTKPRHQLESLLATLDFVAGNRQQLVDLYAGMSTLKLQQRRKSFADGWSMVLSV